LSRHRFGEDSLVSPETDIPDQLLQPPQGRPPSPPVDSSEAALPFGQLSWDDFERLCLRLARTYGEPEHAQPFGTPGQAQSGIDIYSRAADGSYTVYQCKRYTELHPSDIAKAVDRFLEAEQWVSGTRRFVFCTSASVASRQLANEVERQASRLRERNQPLEFTVWDSDNLSALMKERPELVADFFGPAWFERFSAHSAGGAALPSYAKLATRPRQLPAAPAGFVNREREVGFLDQAIAGESRETPSIVVVTGSHGVGKTATGRYWAYTNSSRFADGQLYADFSELRHRGGVSVSDVLGRFLRAFGVTNEDIPIALGERAALFRSSTAGKRILVLLDDVSYAAQVQPLIPNTGEGAVLVTSRDRLAELLRDGAKRLHLQPLGQESAHGLLVRMVGEERLSAEPSAAEQLVEICAGLPVALRVCGALLNAHPSRPLSWLVDELAPEAQRLSRLGLSPEQSLEVVFDESYRALSSTAAKIYRRLGLEEAATFSAPAAAAVAAVPNEATKDALDELVAAHLVEEAGERYRFHDLLALHARGIGQREETADERRAVGQRSVRYYLGAAQRMDRAMIPVRLRLGEMAASDDAMTLTTSGQAFAWFESERPNLVSALRRAWEYELDSEAWQIGEALFPAYHNHKHYDEAREVYELAARAAHRCANLEAEARMRSQLARAYLDMEDFSAAAKELEAARALIEHSDHQGLRASIIEWTGVLESARGNYPEAISAFEEAREIFAALDNQRGIALQDYHLGRTLTISGANKRAVDCLLAAADRVDKSADGLTFGRVLLRLGQAYQSLGELDEAKRALEQAIEVMQRSDAPFYEASARESLAQVSSASGDSTDAAEHLQGAFSIYMALNSPRAQRVSADLDALHTAGESRPEPRLHQ
jgi:tetratricopeptide (TPR) repeat protein